MSTSDRTERLVGWFLSDHDGHRAQIHHLLVPGQSLADLGNELDKAAETVLLCDPTNQFTLRYAECRVNFDPAALFAYL